MTFEELMLVSEPIIEAEVKTKWSGLKTDLEDIKQEVYILLFKKMDIIQGIEQEPKLKKYIKEAVKFTCFAINKKEHKQLLHHTQSISDGETPDDYNAFSPVDESTDFKEPLMERRREYARKYYQKHKEQAKEYHRQYVKEHREQAREYNKRYYLEHKDEIQEYKRRYYQKKKEQMFNDN